MDTWKNQTHDQACILDDFNELQEDEMENGSGGKKQNKKFLVVIS